MLSKTLMFVPVIVLLYSNIKYAGGEGGGMGDILQTRKEDSFLRIKMDYS